jgi:hypothetical protein
VGSFNSLADGQTTQELTLSVASQYGSTIDDHLTMTMTTRTGPTGGGILRSRPRYSPDTSNDGNYSNEGCVQPTESGLPPPSTSRSCDADADANPNHRSAIAVTASDNMISVAASTSSSNSENSIGISSSSSRPNVRTLADLVSSSTSFRSEASGITAAETEMGTVVSHKQVISSSNGRSGGGDNHQQQLSLKSTLLISDAGTPYIKDLAGLSGSGPDVVDADSVIALGVMGEDGQQVRFCEYVHDDEISKGCASNSRVRLDQRMNSEVDAEEDNSDSDDGSSSSHGSAPDEEILRELGLSELNLDDDNNESDDVNATISMENLRSFRILWELLSRWATPSTVELVLHYQGKCSSPSSHYYDGSSSNPSSEQYTDENSRNATNIGASRQASILSMLNMQIPRSLAELRNTQVGRESSTIIDQRMVEERVAGLVRTFDPSAPAADLNMKLWKGLTTILIAIAFPSELTDISTLDESDGALPSSIRRLNMASAEYRYLTRSVFSSLSSVPDQSMDDAL